MLRPDFTFHHTVSVRPWIERGISADVYGDSVKHVCRVDLKRHKILSGGGSPREIEQGAGTVFMKAGTRIPINSILEFDGQRYTVSECRACYDGFTGAENHVEVAIV